MSASPSSSNRPSPFGAFAARWFTRSSLLRILPLALVVALFLVVRLAHTTADPPFGTPEGTSPNELVVEPVAKAYEARTWALTGHWSTSDLDNYGFWRAQSWAWVYPLALWFRVVGVSYASLHVFTSLVAASGLVAVLLLASNRRGPRAAVLAGVMIALNWYDVVYHRVGLIETAVNTWIAWTIFFLDRADRSRAALVGAQITFLLAFFSKANVVVFAPLVLAFGALRFVRRLRAPRLHDDRAARWAPLGVFVVLLAAAALYCSTDAYLRTVVRNSSHVMTGIPVTTAEKVEVPLIDVLFDRYTNPDVWRASFVRVLPIALPLAALQALRVPLGWIRRRSLDPVRDGGLTLLAFLWLVSATFPFAAAQSDVRFRFGTIAPASLLAALFLVDAYDAARAFVTRRWPRLHVAWSWASGAIVGAIATGTFLAHGSSFRALWFDRHYDLARANGRLRELAATRAEPTIVGSWAGPLVFETPFRWYYVRSEFNSTRHQLAGFGLTHLMFMLKGTDFTGATLQSAFPDLGARIRQRDVFAVRGRPILVYEVASEMTETP